MHRPCLLTVVALSVMSCVRAGSSPSGLHGTDLGVDVRPAPDPDDGSPDLGDAQPHDLTSGMWEVAVAADLDDGELDASGHYGIAGYASQGEHDCVTYMGGYSQISYPGSGLTVSFFRFVVPEQLPAGTTITDARLRLFGRDSWEWNPATHTLGIFGELAPDAARITSINDLPGTSTSRPMTAASIKWGVGGGTKLAWVTKDWNRSPDLSPVLQEIIDKVGGLTSGSHIQLFVYRPTPTDNGEVAAEDYCHPDSNQARLSVSFTR